MTFLNPLDALIPKNPFSFFAEFWVRVTRGPGVSLGRILRGPSIEPACKIPLGYATWIRPTDQAV